MTFAASKERREEYFMRAYHSAIVAMLFLLPSSIHAYGKPKPTNQTYHVSCTDLWPAVKATVKEYYVVLSLNDQDQSGSFNTGTAFSGVRALSFSLGGTADTCTVSVMGHFSGITHHDKGDFFSRIEKTLNDKKTPADSSGHPKN